MRLRLVSLLSTLAVTGCFCTSALVHAQSVGVSERAAEMWKVPGVGFLSPDDALMCKAMVSPVAANFEGVAIEQGEGFDFLVANDSEVPVSVVFETRDEQGRLQGALMTHVGPEASRLLTLHFWSGELGPDQKLQTRVRVMALRGSDDISVVAVQRVVADDGTRRGVGQVMYCSEQGCSLRRLSTGLQGGSPQTPDAPAQPAPDANTPSKAPGQAIGPHGPHIVNPDVGAAPPINFPGLGIGPHGPHPAGANEDWVKQLEDGDQGQDPTSQQDDQG